MAESTSLPHPTLRSKQKRGDLVVTEIKRWLISSALKSGDRLPKESDLQKVFAVSKGTAREALKSLEVQGLVTLRAGRDGGATLREVPLERTVQLIQNYFFFKEVDIESIYALRRLLEPELVAGAIPHLTAKNIEQLEHSVDTCDPAPLTQKHAVAQRQEELHFHNILAEANPNSLLRFMCQMLNEMLRRAVVFNANSTLDREFIRFGQANVRAHRRIIAAIVARDANRAKAAMSKHLIDAEKHVRKLRGTFRTVLFLDSDVTGAASPGALTQSRSGR